MPIACFLLTPIPFAARTLRRFAFSAASGVPACPYGYHDATAPLDRVPLALGEPGSGSDAWPHDDPRWPARCRCGYAFRAEDTWQVNVTRLYARSDGGPETTIEAAPVGAMWYADWYVERRRDRTPGPGTGLGPDGRCLMVKTPAGSWNVDGPSSSGEGWTRTGTPPVVTATPSIWVGKPETVPPKGYHGWLNNGYLSDPLP
jgi:hypothetical protein